MISARTFRAQASHVILGRNGGVEAYALGYQWVEGRFYIGQVGTIQSARGRGLARACLLASLRAAAAEGYRSAELNVDSVNPSNAGALYQSVGFQLHNTTAEYNLSVQGLHSTRA
jgi:ribosomal protein S18 acetylase RimI-like enzyme